MKVYKHEGSGHYIGSCVIVFSNSLEEAKQLIRQELDNGGLPDEELDITEFKSKNNTIIYSVNGDY